MRSSLLVFALAGCVRGAGPSAVAWPKASTTQADGGESLAPRPSAHELAASESDLLDEVPAASLDVTPAAVAPVAPAASVAPVEPTSDDPITTDEIVIEITDD